jgi:hypothetical protein
MAGYSGTPLWKKLGIKEESQVLAVDAPKHFRELLDPMPSGAVYLTKPKGEFDVIVSFHRDLETFEERFRALIPHLVDRGGLWISWPKKSSKLYVDGLHENPLRDIGLSTGLVDNKICAIDEDWSGMRFVRRVVNRKS